MYAAIIPVEFGVQCFQTKIKISPYGLVDIRLCFCITMTWTFSLYRVTQNRSNRLFLKSPHAALWDSICRLSGLVSSGMFWVIRSNKHVYLKKKVLAVKTVKLIVITFPHLNALQTSVPVQSFPSPLLCENVFKLIYLNSVV